MLSSNRKGMTSVFLAIAASAMITMAICFISLASERASISSASGVFHLAGRSVLSQYDRGLKNRYGLVVYYGSGISIRDSLLRYGRYTFEELPYMNIGDVTVQLKDYSLEDAENFEEAVAEYTTYNLPWMIKKNESEIHVLQKGERVLRNHEIIDMLPSAAYMDENINVLSLISTLTRLSDVSSLWKAGTKAYLTNLYLFTFFRSGQSMGFNEECFFQDEIEYVLEGKMSDEENMRKVKAQIIHVREALNTVYILAHPDMCAEAQAAAAILTPGPEAVVTEAAVIAMWAKLEAENDWKLLEKGHKVPVYKDASSWALDTGYLLDGLSDTVLPEAEHGSDYEDYLKLLLLMVDKDVKYMRMMDLMQINMKGTENGSFLMKECYVGIHYECDINGRSYRYDETY